jgi:hypothetical protein
MASQLVEHAAMYSAFVVLRAILDCFLFFHEVMVEPKMKQHIEVLFLLEHFQPNMNRYNQSI